jgi:hypothetical protein
MTPSKAVEKIQSTNWKKNVAWKLSTVAATIKSSTLCVSVHASFGHHVKNLLGSILSLVHFILFATQTVA